MLAALVAGCSGGTPAADPGAGAAGRTTPADSASSRPAEPRGGPRIERVPYDSRLGEACGLAAHGSAATVLTCTFGAGTSSATDLVGSDGDEVLDVPGTLGIQIASSEVRPTLWLPTSQQRGDLTLATVREVDVETGTVTPWRAGKGRALTVATAGDRVFVGLSDGVVRALGPTPREVLRTSGPIPLLAVGNGRLWAVDDRGAVSVLDLRSDEADIDVARVPSRPAAGVAVLGGRLFVSGSSLAAVGARGRVQTIDVPGGPVTNLVRCAGRVWTAQKSLGAERGNAPGLRAVEASGTVVRTVRAPFPAYLACSGTALWAVTASRRLYRFDAR